MKFTVRIAAEAEQAILEQAQFIAVDKPQAAENWLQEIYDEIDKLESMPRRHPASLELSTALGCDIRRLIVGEYLLFFRVDDEQQTVDVLRFRHGAQRPPLEAEE